jgi:hypothetical protein
MIFSCVVYSCTSRRLPLYRSHTSREAQPAPSLLHPLVVSVSSSHPLESADLLHHRVEGIAVLHVQLRWMETGEGRSAGARGIEFVLLAPFGEAFVDEASIDDVAELGRRGGRGTHVLRGHVRVHALPVEEEAHGVRLKRLARAERVEDLSRGGSEERS